jgi:hypothetical protein
MERGMEKKSGTGCVASIEASMHEPPQIQLDRIINAQTPHVWNP